MEINSAVDHTLLKPNITLSDVERLCAEAIQHKFAAVCIPPYFVSKAASFLMGSSVKLATVIGFPLGYSATVAKVAEIQRAIEEGADEFDVVINIAALKSGLWTEVRNDIDRMLTACHLRGKTIKVIIESGLLEKDEVERMCDICNELKPDYVKTSTGFNGPGASFPAVELLRARLHPDIEIKASGGIRTVEDAKAFLEAGASRIGTSSGVNLVAS